MKKLLKILINLFTLKSATLQGSIACFDSTANESKLALNEFNYVISDEDAKKLNYDMLITKIKEKLVEVSKPDNNLEVVKIDSLIKDGKLAIAILKKDDSVFQKEEFNHYYGTFKIKVESLKDNDYFTSKKIVDNLKKNYFLDLNEVTFDVSNLDTLDTNEDIIAKLKETINNYLQSQEIDNNNLGYDITIASTTESSFEKKVFTFNFVPNENSFLTFAPNNSKTIAIKKHIVNQPNKDLLDEITSFNSQANLKEQVKTKIWSWYQAEIGDATVFAQKDDIHLDISFENNLFKINYQIPENNLVTACTGTLNLNHAKFNINNIDFSSKTALFLNDYATKGLLIEKAKQQFTDAIITNLNLGTKINNDLNTAIKASLDDITIFSVNGQQRNEITDATENLDILDYQVVFNLANNNYLKKADINSQTLTFNLDWNHDLKTNLNNFNYSFNDAITLNYDNLKTDIKEKLVTSTTNYKVINENELDRLIAEDKLEITFLDNNDIKLNENAFNHYYGLFKIKVETLDDNGYFTSSKTLANLEKKYSLDLSALNFDVRSLNSLNTNQEIINNLRATIDDHLTTQQINNNNFDYTIAFENAVVDPDDTTNKNLHFQITSNDNKFQFVNNVTNIDVTVAKYDLASLNLDRLEVDFNTINNQDDYRNTIINYLKTKLDESYANVLLDYFDSITTTNTQNFTPGTKTITIEALVNDLYFQNNYDLDVEIVKGAGLVNTDENFLDEIVSYHSKLDLETKVKEKIRTWYVEKISQAGDDDSRFFSTDGIDLTFNFANNKLNVDYRIAANNYFTETSGNFVLNNAKIDTQSLNFNPNFWTTTKILAADDAGNVQWLKQEAKKHFVDGIMTNLDFNEAVSNNFKEAIINSLNNFQVFDDQNQELSNLNQDLGVLRYKVSFSVSDNNYLADVDNNQDLFFNLDWEDDLKADLNNLQFQGNQIFVFDLLEAIANVQSATPTQKTVAKVAQLLRDKKLKIDFFDENDNLVNIRVDSTNLGTLTMKIEIKKNRYFKETEPQTPIVKSDLSVSTQRLDLNNVEFNSNNINAFSTDEEIILQLKSKLTSYLEDLDLFSVMDESNTEPLNFDIHITGTDINTDPTKKVVSFEITTTNPNVDLQHPTQAIRINKINLANLRIPKLNLKFANNKDLATVQTNIFNHVSNHLQEDYANFNLNHWNSLTANTGLFADSDVQPINIDATFSAENDNSYFYNDLEFKIHINKLEQSDWNWEQLNLDEIENFNSVAELKREIQRIISGFVISTFQDRTGGQQLNLINDEDIKITGFNIINNKFHVDYKILATTFVNSIEGSLVLNNAQLNWKDFQFVDTIDMNWTSNEPLSAQSSSTILNTIKEQMATNIINSDNFNFAFDPVQKTAFRNMLINSFPDSAIHFSVNSQLPGAQDLNDFLLEAENASAEEDSTVSEEVRFEFTVNINYNDDLKADLSSFNLNLDASESLDFTLLLEKIINSLIAFSLDNNKITNNDLANLMMPDPSLGMDILINDRKITNENYFNDYYGQFKIKFKTLKENRYFRSAKTLVLNKPLLFDVASFNWDSLEISAFDSREVIRFKIKEALSQYLITTYPDYNFNFDIVVSQNPTINAQNKIFNFQLRSLDSKLRFSSNDHAITVSKINLEDIVIDTTSTPMLPKIPDNEFEYLKLATKSLLLPKLQNQFNTNINFEHLQNLNIDVSIAEDFRSSDTYQNNRKYLVTINPLNQDVFFYNSPRPFRYILNFLTRYHPSLTDWGLTKFDDTDVSFNSVEDLNQKVKNKLKDLALLRFGIKQYSNFTSNNSVADVRNYIHNPIHANEKGVRTIKRNLLKFDQSVSFRYNFNSSLNAIDIYYLYETYDSDVSDKIKSHRGQIKFKTLKLNLVNLIANDLTFRRDQDINSFPHYSLSNFVTSYPNLDAIKTEIRNFIFSKIINTLNLNTNINFKQTLRRYLNNARIEAFMKDLQSERFLHIDTSNEVVLKPRTYRFEFYLQSDHFFTPPFNVERTNKMFFDFNLATKAKQKANLNNFQFHIKDIEDLTYSSLISNLKRALIDFSLPNNKIDLAKLDQLIGEDIEIQILDDQGTILDSDAFNSYSGEFKIQINTLKDNRYFKNNKLVTPLVKSNWQSLNFDDLNLTALFSQEDVALKIRSKVNTWLETYHITDVNYEIVFDDTATVIESKQQRWFLNINFLNKDLLNPNINLDSKRFSIVLFKYDLNALHWFSWRFDRLEANTEEKFKKVYKERLTNFLVSDNKGSAETIRNALERVTFEFNKDHYILAAENGGNFQLYFLTHQRASRIDASAIPEHDRFIGTRDYNRAQQIILEN